MQESLEFTHAIDWALTGKTKAKSNKSGIRIGSMIDKTLQDINEGQTNGIPMAGFI